LALFSLTDETENINYAIQVFLLLLSL